MELKILLVDDEQSLVHTLRQVLLLDFPDAHIDEAFSGEEALSCLAESAYDLIIADLRMPGFDGMQLIRGVRYLDPEVPIILMTAFGSETLKEEAGQFGARYIDKPFDIDDIVWTVKQCLGGLEESGE
jgi:DNA-binding response OmpR family regulator